MGGKGTKEGIEKESEVQAINSLVNENFDPRNCTPEPIVNLSNIIRETKIVTRNGDEVGVVHNHNTLDTRTNQNNKTKPNTRTNHINNIKPNTEAIDSKTPLFYDINLMDSDNDNKQNHLNIRERNAINPENKTRKNKIRIRVMIKTILTPLMLGLVTGIILTMGYYSQFGMAATTKCGHVYKSEIGHTSESWPTPTTFSSPLPPSTSPTLTFLQPPPPDQATADSDTTQLPGSTVLHTIDTKTTVTNTTHTGNSITTAPIPVTTAPIPVKRNTTAPIPVKRNTTAPIPMKRITTAPIPVTPAPVPDIPNTTAPIPVTPAPVPDIPTTTAPIQPPGSSTPVETTTTTDRTTRYNVVIKAYMDW